VLYDFLGGIPIKNIEIYNGYEVMKHLSTEDSEVVSTCYVRAECHKITEKLSETAISLDHKTAKRWVMNFSLFSFFTKNDQFTMLAYGSLIQGRILG
jgi:hypothetical protein